MDTGTQIRPESTPVPPYDGDPVNQLYTCDHRTMEADDDELGTTVTEVTVTTTSTTTTNTMTTRKKYRIEGE